MALTLVLGGVRSGKSAWAEALAADLAAARGVNVRYVGTADPADASMSARLAEHRARRPAAWESLDATDALGEVVILDAVTLIDGLGGWIAGRDPATVGAGVKAVIAAAARPGAEVIVVAEQAGEGLLPLDRVARDWLDLLGAATQALSVAAGRAVLLVAGRALELPAPVRPPAP